MSNKSSVIEKSSPIITTTIKNKPEFQRHLANLAKSDAHHDLKAVLVSEVIGDPKIINAFNSGIPTSSDNYYDELGSFASVILNANNSKEELNVLLNNVPNVTDSKGPGTPFQVGLKNETYFIYNVVQFVMECDTNKNYIPYSGNDFGNNFFLNTELGGIGNEAAFIVDFSQHGFMEKLVGGVNGPFKCHYLMTPEVVNDPAGKPNVHNATIFKNGTGVNLYSYIQTDPNDTYYNKYNPNDVSPSNNFFSKYNFTLSPIKQTFTKQKAEKLITNLTISYEWDVSNTKKPLIDVVEDSKGENSNKTVMGFLKKIIDTIKGMADNNPNKIPFYFNFNSKCQQKRGGDWFQILACLDAKNRNYTKILPGNDRSQFKLPSNCPVYLVTHDRIAVSFALLNGVNVIYLDYFGRIFVFKNSADITTKGDGKTIEQIIFDNMKNNWIPEKLNNLINNSVKYMQIINNLKGVKDTLKQFFDDCDNKIMTATTNIQNINVQDDNFTTLLTREIRNIYFSAIKIMFADMNLINIDNDIRFCTDNKNILDANYNVNFNNQIMNLNKAINALVGIQNKFGVIGNDIDNFRSGMGIFLTTNSERLDEYRCVKNLLDGREIDLEKDLIPVERLTNLKYDGNNSQKTDRYIFLPFIQTLKNEFKAPILRALRLVESKIIEYLYSKQNDVNKNSFLKNVISFVKSSRSGSLQKEYIYYNRVANLLYQSFLFLDDGQLAPPIEQNIVPIESDSTDNLVITEDLTIINSLASGRISADTAIVPEEVNNPEKSGGGMEYFGTIATTIKQKTNTICDVSVKQITWKLITYNMLNTDEIYIYNLFYHISSVEEHGEIPNNQFVNFLYDVYNRSRLPIPKGGAKDSQPVDNNLLQNFELGFHPLLPIYALLSPFYYSLEPTYNSNPFFNTYFTYLNVLEKIVDVLDTNYLNNPSDTNKIISSYCLGYCLRTLLFTSNTSLVQNDKILEVIDMQQKDYYTFSLKNDSFSSLITGAIHLDNNEEQRGVILMESELFKNFINNEVNIKQILQQGTPIDNLPTYEILQDRVLGLLTRIVAKVNIDRGTPQYNMQIDESNVSNSKTPSSSSIVGISSEERAAAAAKGQQKYEEKLAMGLLPEIKKTGIHTIQDFPNKDRSEDISQDTSNIMFAKSSTSSSSPNSNSRKGGRKTKKNKKRLRKMKSTRRNKVIQKNKGNKSMKNKRLQKIRKTKTKK